MRLRVISGKLGGRRFNSPSGHRTHPMSEKIRSAVFNMLGDITGLDILDAFGGSGSLAFESYSRGASNVYVVERDSSAYETIKENAESLGIEDDIQISLANVSSWLKTNELSFDIIFCDPPYNDINPKIVEILPKYLNIGGLMVCSFPTAFLDELDFSSKTLEQISQKNYANASIVIYKRLK